MSLEKLVQQRIDRLESIPAKLQSTIDSKDELLFKQILKDIGSLKTEDGKIVSSKENLSKINAIIQNLKNSLFGSDYIDAIKEFAGQIQVQANLNNSILETVIGSFNDDEVYKSAIQNSQKNALMLMDENAVSSNFLQPIQDLITNSIITGSSYTDMVSSLRNNMVGENAIFSKYAGQIIKDTFAISDRQYVQLTARTHGIEFYRYDGPKIKGSRYFCCVRKDKIFHYKEISSWGNKESLWNNPKNGGSCEAAHGGGRNPDTNSATIFSYLGGYGCIDVLVPVATEYVPTADIQRAISLGYFQASA